MPQGPTPSQQQLDDFFPTEESSIWQDTSCLRSYGGVACSDRMKSESHPDPNRMEIELVGGGRAHEPVQSPALPEGHLQDRQGTTPRQAKEPTSATTGGQHF